MTLFTIGAFGSTSEEFFGALEKANIDTFCDIRARRGVRGAEYSFVNSKRLQSRLAELGIRYIHLPELAPTEEVRNRQAQADADAHVAKRRRTVLSEEFKVAYEQTVMRVFDSIEFLATFPKESQRTVLFCVERAPEACHRSLLAARLQKDLALTVTHLLP